MLVYIDETKLTFLKSNLRLYIFLFPPPELSLGLGEKMKKKGKRGSRKGKRREGRGNGKREGKKITQKRGDLEVELFGVLQKYKIFLHYLVI